MRKAKRFFLVATMLALVATVGEKMAAGEFERRKKRGGGRFRRTKRAGGHSSQGRAGVKLVRKMYKRRDNPAWVKLHPRPTHSGANRGRSTARVTS